jgi:hypothetical protein
MGSKPKEQVRCIGVLLRQLIANTSGSNSTKAIVMPSLAQRVLAPCQYPVEGCHR